MAETTAKIDRVRWLAVCAIVLGGLAAYYNSFSGAFIFDDFKAIQENPTIRQLWPLGAALSPPQGGFTVSGRPILNLSLAINYALGGTNLWGYHALNLAIHILAGLTLFGIMRRTLERFHDSAGAMRMAFAVALLWTVHPLQTESVTYIIQRAESLMGLFYLLTLYGFIRGAEANGRGWLTLAVAACLLGMATKEVMVSAPVIVLLYDRTFVAGSFREAWGKRRAFYLCLFGTWLVLAALVAGTGNRGGTSGFGAPVSPWAYWVTQSPAVVNYLRLSVWPHPLVFDYGFDMRWVRYPLASIPHALAVILIVAGTAYAVFGPARPGRRALGFAGAWFFAILAPTSVMPGTLQTMAEHRMYLALAPVMAVVVVSIHWAWRRLRPVGGVHRSAGLLSAAEGKAALAIVGVLAVGLGIATARRNEDYRSLLAIWSDTVLKNPGDTFAHTNMGNALLAIPGRLPDAIAHFEAALKIDPEDPITQSDLGLALAKTPGRLPEAIAHFEAALKLKPDYADAQNNLGNALLAIPGRLPDAIAHYEAALRIKPDYAKAHSNLGMALAKMPGRLPDAIAQFEAALKINPDDAEAHNELGMALGKNSERLPDAIAQFEAVLKIDPDDTAAHNNLGLALAKMPGRLPDAIAQFEAALKADPNDAEAHYNLAFAFSKTPGRLGDTIAQLEAVLTINPDDAEAHYNLGITLLSAGHRNQEAWAQFEAALRLRPDWEPMVARLRSAQH